MDAQQEALLAYKPLWIKGDNKYCMICGAQWANNNNVQLRRVDKGTSMSGFI